MLRETDKGSGCSRSSRLLQPGLYVGEGNTQRGAGDTVQRGFRSAQMDGPMDVRKALAGGQRGGRGGGFQLEEWTHWFGPGRRRTIVVAVGRVAAVRVVLELPERIDVISGAGGHSVLHDGQHLVVSVVTARDALAALGVHADFAAVFAVRGEVDQIGR